LAKHERHRAHAGGHRPAADCVVGDELYELLAPLIRDAERSQASRAAATGTVVALSTVHGVLSRIWKVVPG
jgi:hypothetical protein